MSVSAALPQPRPRVLADVIPGAIARDLALIAGGAGFIGVLAQLAVHMPGTPVPITGQTLGVLLVGTAYGARRAAAAIALYAVAGVLGVPWFAGHSSGYVNASFGYVIGFLAAGTMCGFLAGRKADRSVRRSIPVMLAGQALIYGAGMAWLAAVAHLTAGQTISQGLLPFLLGDVIKAALAAGLTPIAWALVDWRY
ncbi:biotin transporter BioY [Actinoplanes sp. L3-i22]|uniref:biotin transporter BioY n=1 Tax=Actinoplanes sp. L3-i22 TaxID=2836373 RepID=UPI001C75A2D5|nr:biotin transporter BioY [Actinoplanes sp. L3-i22]BCY13452.1 biotin synthase [Actinoplanes sp. L3-i22]